MSQLASWDVDRRLEAVASRPIWLRCSASVSLMSAVALLCTSLFTNLARIDSAMFLALSILIALAIAASITAHSLVQVRSAHRSTLRAFHDTDCGYSSIFQNVLDGILIVDDEAVCLDANPAAVAILRVAIAELIGEKIERFLVANEDTFRKNWNSFLRRKHMRGRARLIAGDGSTLFVDFTAAANYLPGRHVLIVCDATSRKQAEMKLSEQLDLVEAARAEAEALRKATLALSKNLAMDAVLDTMLACIQELVPYDKATVMFVEDGAELLVAREAPRATATLAGAAFPAAACNFLERILFEKRTFLVSDMSRERDLIKIKSLGQFRSWIGVPLVASGHVLGILSLGKRSANAYTPEHLRLAKCLAVPAAVAIQNARTHERAEIYAAELELRLEELRNMQASPRPSTQN